MRIEFDTPVKNFQKATLSRVTTHIVFVEISDKGRQFEYAQENWYFSFMSVEDTSLAILNGTLHIDAVFIESNANQGQMHKLAELLKTFEIPFILYSRKFEIGYKEKALKLKVDDYLFGALTDSMLTRLTFIKKIKAYKNKRNNKPYELTKVQPMQSIKIWRLKRVSDIVIALFALVALSPIMLLIALIIKLESKGSIFYISKRAGSGYKIFDFYKFRSMRTGADKELKNLGHLNQYSEGKNDSNSIFFKIKDDPRVTPFGQFLRNTSLDELPQLINVLKGDMSIVGNRPLPLYEAEQLTKDQIAWRFLAPAGITGLWQVTKRGNAEMSLDERIHLDVQYAMKNSFTMDMKIIFSTFPALFQKEKV
jgi:lipopolysaccharide/colanic/teichoic acid biosynthesis glycosyltransferase